MELAKKFGTAVIGGIIGVTIVTAATTALNNMRKGTTK